MRVRVTHRKQLARQKFSHQTILVIRSIKSVQLVYWFFYFTDFFANQGARRRPLRKCSSGAFLGRALMRVRVTHRKQLAR